MDDFDLFEDNDAASSAAVLTQQSLVDTQQRLGSMLDALPVGLLIHTEQGVIFANREAGRLLKVDRNSIRGQHLLDYVRQSELGISSAQFRASFLGVVETLDQESVIVRPDGSERLVRLISGRLPWEGNPVIQVLMLDITDQKRAENSLRQLTITDELTGAYNRRHAFYEAALYVESDNGIALSVILIDIDHFKRINDTYGHAVGDIALKELTSLAHAFVPTIAGTDSAIFARVGGEEFVILLPGLELEQGVAVGELFRDKVEHLRIPVPTGNLNVTASMGVATYRADDKSFHGTLNRADEALYEAKGAGRNRVHAAK